MHRKYVYHQTVSMHGLGAASVLLHTVPPVFHRAPRPRVAEGPRASISRFAALSLVFLASRLTLLSWGWGGARRTTISPEVFKASSERNRASKIVV